MSSRRAAELLIQQGRVTLNGKTVTELGTKANPHKDTIAIDGKPLRQRITWSKLDGGRVRQLWESSTDDGRTWSVAFDGTYVPKPKRP